MDPEKGKQPSKEQILAEINKYHLGFVGYSAADITAFGELGKLPKARMGELIHRKALEKANKSYNKAPFKTVTFRTPDEE